MSSSIIDDMSRECKTAVSCCHTGKYNILLFLALLNLMVVYLLQLGRVWSKVSGKLPWIQSVKNFYYELSLICLV